MSQRLGAALLAMVIAVWLAPAASFAQDFPSRAITIIVAQPPGGGTDIISRIFAQRLSERRSVLGHYSNEDRAGDLIFDLQTRDLRECGSLVVEATGERAAQIRRAGAQAGARTQVERGVVVDAADARGFLEVDIVADRRPDGEIEFAELWCGNAEGVRQRRDTI